MQEVLANKTKTGLDLANDHCVIMNILDVHATATDSILKGTVCVAPRVNLHGLCISVLMRKTRKSLEKTPPNVTIFTEGSFASREDPWAWP